MFLVQRSFRVPQLGLLFLFWCVGALLCASDTLAQDPNYIMTAGSQGGDAGTSVVVPVTLDSSAGSEIQGVSLGICNDTAVVTFASVDLGATLAVVNNGQPPAFVNVDSNVAGFAIGVVINLLGMATLPPLADIELFDVTYNIQPAAPTGSTPLSFCTFGTPPVVITVVVAGASILPTTVDGEIVVGGSIEAFERGDCNSDGSRNIADAIALLGNLFPGANPVIITCDDACDTNDDGSTNIADAIFMLNTLFGPEMLPEPLNCGADPSDNDPLNCDVSGAC